jgi:hypothetical protein
MPATKLLLISIGILSVCVLLVHVLVRHHLHRSDSMTRSRSRTRINGRPDEWLTHSRTRNLTSASV